MTAPDARRNAYTDAPQLHPNLILGSLQLFIWLFAHHSAWSSFVSQIDPGLRPEFWLGALDRKLLGNPALHRLLIIILGVWPLLLGLVVGTFGWASSGQPLAMILYMVAILGYSMAIGSAIGLAVSLAIAPILMIMSVVVYLLPTFAPYPLVYGISMGIVGSLAVQIVDPQLIYQFGKQFGRIVAGTLIGALTIALTSTIVFRSIGQSAVAVGAVAGGISGGVALILACGWRRGIVYSVLAGVIYQVLFALSQVIRGWEASFLVLIVDELATGLMQGLFVSVAFALPFTLAYRIAGASGGPIAGALGAGAAVAGIRFLISGNGPVEWSDLAVRLAGVILGLTFMWWRSFVAYPVEAVWNLFLLQRDRKVNGTPPHFLRWHSAFWDESQRLPLYGLDEHLILVAERDPQEAAAASAYLISSHQRWAAQAAQVELDARRLGRCSQVESIGQAHNGLATGELEGPASALLRSFGRISQDADAALRQESSYNQRLALRAVEADLDGLLRELTRSSDRYAVRFTPITTKWRDVVAAHVRELTEAVELRQEIDSPYVIGVPLTRQQEIFVGRTDIGTRIEQLLLDRRRPPLLLYGQRRTGKTSLLNNLGRLLPSSIVPLFVDLQGPATQASDHTGFLYNLARGIVDSAQRERGLVLPPLDRESLTADPFTRFDEWLDQVEAALGRNTALLSLDEFEALDRALTQGRFNDADVLGMLRNLIQHRPRFKVLLAGSHTLEELERWAGYLINVQVVHISYLKEDEARKLVEQPVAAYALRYEPDASQRVLDLTHCHPFLVQLLCGEIVALKNEQEVAVRRLARLADVEAAVTEALSHGSFFFADIERNQVDADSLSILRALALQGEGATMNREQLAAQLTDPGRLERSLTSLIQRELIEPADGGYRFQVELIRRWFANRSR